MVQDKVVVTTDVLLIMSASTIAVESTIVRHSKHCTHFKKGCTGFQFSETGWSRIWMDLHSGRSRIWEKITALAYHCFRIPNWNNYL